MNSHHALQSTRLAFLITLINQCVKNYFSTLVDYSNLARDLEIGVHARVILRVKGHKLSYFSIVCFTLIHDVCMLQMKILIHFAHLLSDLMSESLLYKSVGIWREISLVSL